MKCWIDRQALAEVIDEGSRTFPMETGGLLAGYWAGDEVVITHAIGPGPNAKHERLSFDPDCQWQSKEIIRLYEVNDREITYLGDWHTHPCGPTIPSDLDKRAIQNIADNEAARASRPLMLIVGGTLDVFSLYCLKQGDLTALAVQTYTKQPAKEAS